MTIFHFITIEEWSKAQLDSLYTPHSLETDGFIHCCTSDQLDGMAKRLSNAGNNLLLEIDEDLVEPQVIYEDLYGLNQLFPHIYGALNLNSIRHIHQVE
ncbi:DUF952 domain-containing protein [Paenibacillus kobensis]|uniref:DUF952 domain-containing protein n=1 Tax=Paenibacillus kobensis TaxID=59841 RepID=UPI00248328D4|nr:DUF952 domain-containing protein [Paenibacillus kobensis]